MFKSEIHGEEEADIPLDWTWSNNSESGQQIGFKSGFTMDVPSPASGSLDYFLPISLSSFPVATALTHSPSLSLSVSLSLSLFLSLSLHELNIRKLFTPLPLLLFSSPYLSLALSFFLSLSLSLSLPPSLSLSLSLSSLWVFCCGLPRTPTARFWTRRMRTWAGR